MAGRGRPRGFDREAALRRAMEVFWDKGFEGASIATLTEAMGIGAPSLYAAFGNKDDLYREAMALYGSTEGARLWEAVAAADDARGAVEALLKTTATLADRDDAPRGCMVALAVANGGGASEAACADLRHMRLKSIAHLERLLRDAEARGEIGAGTDCHAVASYYVTVQQGMSLRARDGASSSELLVVAEAAMAAWDPLTGAAAPSGAVRRSARASRRPPSTR